MTTKEKLDLPVDAPLLEDVDGALTVELETILESAEGDVVSESAVEDVLNGDAPQEPVAEEVKPEEAPVEPVAESVDEAPVEGEQTVAEDVKPEEGVEAVSEEVKPEEAPVEGVKEDFEVSLAVGAGDIDLSEDIEAIFGGADEALSEEFKAKATGIFEAAVTAKVNETLETYIEKVNTESKERFAEATEKHIDAVAQRLDGYLDVVVENWVDANKEALGNQLMLKLSESFMSGIKNLFESHYVKTDGMQVDVIKSLSEEKETLEGRLTEQLDINVKLKNAVVSERRKLLVERAAADLSETEKTKFLKLAEGVVFTNSENFNGTLEDIKEAYFADSDKSEIIVNGVEHDDHEVVTESVQVPDKKAAGMDKTLKYISGR